MLRVRPKHALYPRGSCLANTIGNYVGEKSQDVVTSLSDIPGIVWGVFLFFTFYRTLLFYNNVHNFAIVFALPFFFFL